MYNNINTIEEISAGLRSAGYIPTRQISAAAAGTILHNHPLLVEGDSGVGKTSLAYAVGSMLKLPVIRVSFYEGITADKILYDYDYQKQLLTIQAIASSLQENLKNKSVSEAIDSVKDLDFYGRDFLLARPLLQSISGQRCVLILDELDKASEEVEYILLEFLENYSISIPQYGTIQCPKGTEPVVFLTSNNYRELSEALCRRCNFLYIPEKTRQEVEAILQEKSIASADIQKGVAQAMQEIRNIAGLNQKPSIAEAVSWADFLERERQDGMLGDLNDSVFLIAKNREDQNRIISSGIMQKRLAGVFAGA